MPNPRLSQSSGGMRVCRCIVSEEFFENRVIRSSDFVGPQTLFKQSERVISKDEVSKVTTSVKQKK